MPNRLMPVQPDGSLPLNFFDVEKPPEDRVIPAEEVIEKPMTVDRIHELSSLLRKYKEGKTNLENRIVENEQWWKGRNWEQIRRPNEQKGEIEPVSQWLFNALANKHADAMDNYPRANILPREKGDIEEAKKLSSIVPVIFEQNNFEQTYDDEQRYKHKTGTGVYSVTWNKNLCNGLGDVDVNRADLLNLFWEPGLNDWQDSPYLFVTDIKDNDYLAGKYPQLKGKLGGQSNITVKEYIYDDTVDTTNKTVVVDCYYKIQIKNRTVLHLVTFVNDTILYSSENENREQGIYNHGRYPFVPDVLFKVEGTPAGFGYLDIAKSAQEYIDRMDKALIESLEESARARVAISDSCGLNEKEYADRNKKIIHANDLSAENFQILQTPPVSSIYVQIKENKIQELKEVTGNRDVSTGGTTSGVTAASAIAAMQEAGSKLSRDMIKSSFRAFREVVLLTIELIRQFYDIPRQFRILGDSAGEYEFIPFSNENIKPKQQEPLNGVDMGMSMPLFDVEITAEKASPYSRMSRNELALQLNSQGFFAPENSDQALACMEMLDFDGKDQVMERISQNGQLYQMLIQRTQQALQLAEMVDQMTGDNIAPQIAQEMTGMMGAMQPQQAMMQAPQIQQEESPVTRNARQRVAESTSPT